MALETNIPPEPKATKEYTAEDVISVVSRKNDDLIRGYNSLPVKRWADENQLCQTEMLSSIYILMVRMNERLTQLEDKPVVEVPVVPHLVDS